MDDVEKIWSLMIKRPLVAGPWVSNPGCVMRFGWHGEPLALAYSQEEVEAEDFRLQKLGYSLTDQNRKIPSDWFEQVDESDLHIFQYERYANNRRVFL